MVTLPHRQMLHTVDLKNKHYIPAYIKNSIYEVDKFEVEELKSKLTIVYFVNDITNLTMITNIASKTFYLFL